MLACIEANVMQSSREDWKFKKKKMLAVKPWGNNREKHVIILV